MENKKPIYCPICHRLVSRWDRRTTMNIIADCKKCKIRVVYIPTEDRIKTMKIPPRNCSSGKTFY